MQGVGEELLRGGQLHHVAQVHDADAVADILHHAQVVGDEEVGQVLLLLQVGQQVEDLGLDGHVQSGHGLVAHHKGGVEGQAAGDADTLPLAAGELVGVTAEHIGVQAAVLHDLEDIVPHGGVAPLEDAVGHQALTDDLTHRHTGVQGGVGVLEDELQVLAQHPHLLLGQLLQVDVLAVLVVDDVAVGLGIELQQGAAQSGLTAAGLAHQTQGLTGIDVQGDTVVGADIALLLPQLGLFHREILLHVPDGQQHLFLILHVLSSPQSPGRNTGPNDWARPPPARARPACTSRCSICSGGRTCSPWAGTAGWAPRRG